MSCTDLHSAVQELHGGTVGVEVNGIIGCGALEHQQLGIAAGWLHLLLHLWPIEGNVLLHGLNNSRVEVVGIDLPDSIQLQGVTDRPHARGCQALQDAGLTM